MQTRPGKKAAEVGDQGLWFIQLPPGHVDHSPACGLETPVSLAVTLEGNTGAMRFTAVQLDDHPMLAPKAVRLHFPVAEIEEGVELWLGQVAAGEQGCEPRLQPASHTTPRPGPKTPQAGRDGCRSALSGMPFEVRFELSGPETVEVFRLSDNRFHAFDGEDRGHVADGPSQSRDWDPAPQRHFIGGQPQAMPANRSGRSGRTGCRDVDALSRLTSQDPPEFRRGAMA